MKVLHLFNEYVWYDMIEQGEKPEEYRDIETWSKRICRYGKKQTCGIRCAFGNHTFCKKVATDYTHVCIHRAYTKTTMLWSIDQITIGKGNPKWGAPKCKVFIIKLKERVK